MEQQQKILTFWDHLEELRMSCSALQWLWYF